jgi:hypothetical protein
MELNTIQLKKLKEDGIVKINSFLSPEETKNIIKIINPFIGSKGDSTSYFSVNFKQNLLKVIKFEFKKILVSIKLNKIAKIKKMCDFANMAFEKKSYLKMIDCYNSPISELEVLPWHIDQAYRNRLSINDDEIFHPDSCSIKFFIYLTNVGTNNGCTSYIPGTHKITHALRVGLKEKKIKYMPHWSLQDLRKFIQHKNNFPFFTQYFGNDYPVNEFLEKTSFIDKDIETTEFDFNMSPGDAIIFNEGGVHKGSKTLYNERKVLRYHYIIKNII